MTERLHFHFSLSCIGEGNGNPLQGSCLENPRDGGAWWAAVCGVTQTRTWLKWLSSSSVSSSSKCWSWKILKAYLIWQFLKKLNTELPYNPAIRLQNIPKDLKARTWTSKYMYAHNSCKGDATQNTHWQTKCGAYIWWSVKKERNLTYATTWTEFNKISQLQKDKYCIISLIWDT